MIERAASRPGVPRRPATPHLPAVQLMPGGHRDHSTDRRPAHWAPEVRRARRRPARRRCPQRLPADRRPRHRSRRRPTRRWPAARSGRWRLPDALFAAARAGRPARRARRGLPGGRLPGRGRLGLRRAAAPCSSTSSPRCSTARRSTDLLAIADAAPRRAARRPGDHRARAGRAPRRAAAHRRAGPRPRLGIALDDVGADSASLAFMPLLRPDVVKLDLRPGAGAARRPATAEIMHAVNAYAERSGALVLAEGIENERHLASRTGPGRDARAGLAVRPARPRARPRPARARPRPGLPDAARPSRTDDPVALRLPARRRACSGGRRSGC